MALVSDRIFTLTIRMEGAAFGEEPGFTWEAAVEVGYLLYSAAEQVDNGNTSGPLVDHNGQTVGRFEMKEVDEPTP